MREIGVRKILCIVMKRQENEDINALRAQYRPTRSGPTCLSRSSGEAFEIVKTSSGCTASLAHCRGSRPRAGLRRIEIKRNAKEANSRDT